jgi:hypothetical protein
MSLHRVGFACFVVLLWMMAGSGAVAQGRSGSLSNDTHQAWAAGDEITMGGLVQEVLTKHPAGGPAGFNFVMTAAQKPLTVNAGFGLGESVRNQLRSGVPVQVTGLTRTMNGQSYLLARVVVVGGQAIQVRSKNGFPVHAVSTSGRTEVRSKSVQNNLQGGAR